MTSSLCASPVADAARAHRQAGRFAEAAASYRQAISADPKDAASWHGLVMSLAGGRKLAEAKKAADDAERNIAGTPELQVIRGFALLRRGNLVGAESAYRTALTLRQNYPWAMLGLSRIQSYVSRFQTASRLADQASRLMPDEPEAIMAALPPFGPRHIAELERALSILDPATESARVVRVHLQQDKLLGDRHASVLSSRWGRYEVKLIRMSMKDSRVGVEVRVNGRAKTTLLLDSGASGLILSRDFAERAGVALASPEAYEDNGIGDGKRPSLHSGLADSLSVGELKFQTVPVSILKHVGGVGVGGIIGTDIFAQFVITLDFRAARMLLEPHGDEPNPPDLRLETDAPAKMPDGYFRFFRIGHMLLMPTSVSGAPHRMFLIDTGASLNSIDPDVPRSYSSA